MKVIYDSAGAVIATDLTPIDTTKTITGTLYSIDVTVPEGKVIDHVDVSVIPHVPVFVDVPKSEQEMTIEQIKKAVPNLISMDGMHTKAISTIQNDIAGALQRIAQLENRVKKLEG